MKAWVLGAWPYVRIHPAAANGYTLDFGGALPGMAQAVTCQLDVE